MKSLFKESTIIEEEVLDWYAMTSAERFVESLKLWEVFELLGGHYVPEHDTQSPFYSLIKNRENS